MPDLVSVVAERAYHGNLIDRLRTRGKAVPVAHAAHSIDTSAQGLAKFRIVARGEDTPSPFHVHAYAAQLLVPQSFQRIALPASKPIFEPRFVVFWNVMPFRNDSQI